MTFVPKFSELHPRRFFLQSWCEIDEEATAARREPGGQGGTLIAAYVFVVVAVSLILQEYYGDRQTFFRIVRFVDDPSSPRLCPLAWALFGWLKPSGGTLMGLMERGDYVELWNLAYWALARVVGFLVLPIVAVLAHPRMHLRDLGLSFEGAGRHVWIYVVLFVPVLCAVIAVSFTSEFSTYYPFYVNAHRSAFDFAVWEAFYVAQFFSLELFFRGFMLQPLRRTMGSPAIFAMMIPYCMIHFGKPFPECFAAILAGIVLGTLALRTRSIWCGFLIHVSVALSMDVAAILQVHG
jgi:membrane protease YdiL (CAAX protease family)